MYRQNLMKKTENYIISKSNLIKWAQLAGAVEYTDCISAEG